MTERSRALQQYTAATQDMAAGRFVWARPAFVWASLGVYSVFFSDAEEWQTRVF